MSAPPQCGSRFVEMIPDVPITGQLQFRERVSRLSAPESIII